MQNNLIPSLAPVRQQIPTGTPVDVSREVLNSVSALGLEEKVLPGMRIAVGTGSRGIPCVPQVLQITLEALKGLGADAFIVPAMGSHGGGTAEGQRAVLEGYGIHERSMGVPVFSSMETVVIGETPQGMPVYFDAHAAQADGILVVNRIKEHTAFTAPWGSGILKMLTVGMGKADAAAEIHKRGVTQSIPPAGRVVLEKLPILGGIAIVENGIHQPVKITALLPGDIEATEPGLVKLSRQLTPRIPFDPLDLLVLHQIGKDISGTGMDLNTIGMWRRSGGPVEPQIRMLAALGLTANSHGNAIGVGYADLIPQRLHNEIDLAATYKNCITSQNWAGARIPITLPNDRQVFETALSSIAGAPRLALVHSTLDLEVLWVSEALLGDLPANPDLEQLGALRPLKFGTDGTLVYPQIV
jgi:hypothetical protein